MEMKTVNDLRKMIVEEMEKVRDGKSSAASLNAVVNGAGKIFSSIKLEIEYNKAIGKSPFIPMLKNSDDETKREKQKATGEAEEKSGEREKLKAIGKK